MLIVVYGGEPDQNCTLIGTPIDGGMVDLNLGSNITGAPAD